MKSSKEWMSISDMMTGLMMIFLFISVLYIIEVKNRVKCDDFPKKFFEKTTPLLSTHIKSREDIYNKLQSEFGKNSKQWGGAEIVKQSLAIRFSPDIIFDTKDHTIKSEFKIILNQFCPRFFNILYSMKENISEIRIEGHTSTEWLGLTKEQAYFRNMQLSQDRTRSVLEYCANLSFIDENIKKWSIKKLTANGLSSSRPLPFCSEDIVRCRKMNRRVEFRIQTNETSILDQVKDKSSKFVDAWEKCKRKQNRDSVSTLDKKRNTGLHP